MSNNMKGKLKTLAAGAAAIVATGSQAFAQTTDYVADIKSGVDSVIGIWDVIVPVMIGIAVVSIGLRFAKKLR